MIKNVDIEHYFRNNIDKIKKRKFLSVVAWKSGSLVNCMGKTEIFEIGKSEIMRRGEYDYFVFYTKKEKNVAICTNEEKNVAFCTNEENDLVGEAIPLKEKMKSKRNAAGLKKKSFRTIVQEKIINR